MPNYQNSKIYKIESLIGNCVYYGSTTNKYLSTRMGKHRHNNNTCVSRKVLEYDDAKIILVETYPCNDKNELTARECYYIKNNDCVNKQIPGRTDKQYRIDNKEKKINTARIYYIKNKEKIKEQVKQYAQLNKEKLNKKHNCECGGKYTKKHKKNHMKTKKHINYIKNSN